MNMQKRLFGKWFLPKQMQHKNDGFENLQISVWKSVLNNALLKSTIF